MGKQVAHPTELQFRDVQEILMYKKLDKEYLTMWCTKLGVENLLEKALQDE